MSDKVYDVLVIGGGAIGLGAAYEVAKAEKSVLVLEKRNFYNQSGSSGDIMRMFRTMYTEEYMAILAHECLDIWDELEEDAGDSLRLMTGLLNFGDPKYGAGGPEGTLTGPIDNLQKLHMTYRMLTKQEIEKQYPFKDLPDYFEGIFAPDNGVINVTLLLRTLARLAQSYGADLRANTSVDKIERHDSTDKRAIWKVKATRADGSKHDYYTEKIIITCGAYANHVLTPSFNFHLKLDIWEMVSTYFGVNAGPGGTIFPSMWFQFAENEGNQSRLYYGFPAVPWGPPNLARISVDDATNRITDPSQRRSNVVNAEDIANTQKFIKKYVEGVDDTVPASALTCLQTNVYDNMFVLDFVPEKYLGAGYEKSIAVFTAGWAMKFVPLLGRALKEMVLDGVSKYERPEFSMTRTGETDLERIIVDGPLEDVADGKYLTNRASGGSSMKCRLGH